MISETTDSKKSGQGMSHGVVSELTTFFKVKPGHEEDMRAACQRFNTMLIELGDANQKSGLREWRQVLFDNDTRILLMTSFETDWDPYIDDAITIIGADYFIDWLKHTVESDTHREELRETVEAARKGIAATAPLKALLKQNQARAAAFFDVLSDETVPQIRKAQRVQKAFQQVLDDPAAEQALQQPALKPLLAQAAD